MFTSFFVLVLSLWPAISYAFMVPTSRSLIFRQSTSSISMEYIPDGLTKQQWAALQKKEEEELKKKGNLGAVGTTRFKSRSFEAWQKSGAKHLFPVNPENANYEERPYMQRRGGDWEGTDLKSKGLEGSGQGEAAKRNKIDNIYEGLQKEGKLNSVSFFGGQNLPWTSEAAAKMNNIGTSTAKSTVKLTPAEEEKLKKSLAKVIDSKKDSKASPVAAEIPKKKMFGLF